MLTTATRSPSVTSWTTSTTTARSNAGAASRECIGGSGRSQPTWSERVKTTPTRQGTDMARPLRLDLNKPEDLAEARRLPRLDAHQPAQPARRSKYRNVKTEEDGILF